MGSVSRYFARRQTRCWRGAAVRALFPLANGEVWVTTTSNALLRGRRSAVGGSARWRLTRTGRPRVRLVR